MNKVILMGRLIKAPEIKYLQDDNKTAMARYTLAVDRRYGKDREREADFIPCVTFGKNAEFAEIYLKKGTKIVISGRIRTGSYTDSEGVKRYSSKRRKLIMAKKENFQEYVVRTQNEIAGTGFLKISRGVNVW
ncbi:single-stranded DNA-binding protein [Firmicutes bacterium OM04-13BH]|nr:single-stranded DNA-binding protein [Firmicutes bacterium AM10-47]RHV47338.1 single-stranded DNA-binding protein [Firmicutes bacterium OM04-13BH]